MMNSREFFGLLLRRAWLVVVLVALSATTTWVFSRDQPKIYEENLTFVLHPSRSVPRERIPETVLALRQDGPLVQTVRAVLSSSRLFELAARRSRTRADLSTYTLTSSVKPGSSLFEVSLRGPERTVLSSLRRAFAPIASAWVADRYDAYTLEFLQADAPPEPVAPRVEQSVILAGLLGALLAVAVLFVELVIRSRTGSAPKEAEGALVSVDQEAGPEPAAEQATQVDGLDHSRQTRSVRG